MRNLSVWARVLRLEGLVIERAEVELDSVIIQVRPKRRERGRCGICRRRCRGYDQGEGRRRWRALDLGFTFCYLEAEAPRVSCAEHGVVVAAVPWARHDSRFTRAFEDQAAWLATQCSKTAVVALLRIAWSTIGAIITRVVAEARTAADPFAGLRRIGIDEISYRRGHRYLMVVVNHDTGQLIWAADGRDRKTLKRFFLQLGRKRCRKITQVSCDGADWIADLAATRCPNAEICLDPFHVVQWATNALDEVRRAVWNAARRAGFQADAKDVKGARWVLLKNPGDLTGRQRRTLAFIARTNRPLYRAYLLKEQLRKVFQLDAKRGMALLDRWLQWARRCRIQPFVDLARHIVPYLSDIESALRNRLSNALVESVNTRLRLITRRSFGFHSPEPLIALAMLSLGGLCPALPGRGLTHGKL